MAAENQTIKIVCENRKAHFNYQILERFEAGMVLTGSEIKSVRQGGISINESFVRPEGEEVFALQINIAPYAFSPERDYDPARKRKLLLHAREINVLRAAVERRGQTIVPLKVYLKRGRAKIEIAIAKGKASPDKRQTIKKREGDREAERAMKNRSR